MTKKNTPTDRKKEWFEDWHYECKHGAGFKFQVPNAYDGKGIEVVVPHANDVEFELFWLLVCAFDQIQKDNGVHFETKKEGSED